MVGKLKATFTESSPRLGAKLEKHIETGSAFAEASQAHADPVSWTPPPGTPGVPKR